MLKLRHLILSMILLSLMGAGCGLASDVTPPPALATAQMAAPLPTQPPTSVPVSISPEMSLDLDNGSQIYAEKCSGCHGPTGMGDGELAVNLDVPPAALGDPNLARSVSPQMWFTIVTEGNIAQFMPGFSSLSDVERWDVVGYSLSLSISTEELTVGQEIYQTSCAACHGARGEGGPSGPSLVERELGFGTSLEGLFQVVSAGKGVLMPAFQETLTEEVLLAVVAYTRQLATGIGPVTMPIVSVETDPEPSSTHEELTQGVIRGQVINGTNGATVPEDIQVTLSGFDGEVLVVDKTSEIDEAGEYEFTNLEIVSGRLYLTSIEYEGLIYQSEIAHLIADNPMLDLPLTIYESANDSSQLLVDRLHILFEFPTEDILRILELWVLSNPTDQVMDSSGSEGVFQVHLPDEAMNIRFEEGVFGDRFLPVENGFADTQPISPGIGIHQLVFSYDLPYERRLDFQQIVEYPVGAVVILVPVGGPEVSGPGVIDLGARDMGGIMMHQFSMDALGPGDSIDIRISGKLSVGGDEGFVSEVAIGGVVLLLAGFLVYGYWRGLPGAFGGSTGRGQPAMPSGPDRKPRSREAIIREIALLDEQFEAGELPLDEYQARRIALKDEALKRTRQGDD